MRGLPLADVADPRLAAVIGSWSGADDANTSGLASYTIYISDDGGLFIPWLIDMLTQATLEGYCHRRREHRHPLSRSPERQVGQVVRGSPWPTWVRNWVSRHVMTSYGFTCLPLCIRLQASFSA